jgi:hypothetical protein
MAGIRISQLATEAINSGDFFPIARGTSQTYKAAANQIVTAGQNSPTGSGVGVFDSTSTGNTRTLIFRTLSGTDENLSITQVGSTIVINTSAQNPVKFKYQGNGTTTAFTVGGNLPKNINNYRVDIDGVLQEPGADYNLVGSNIVFTDAPPLSSKVVIVTNNLLKTVEAVPLPNTITCEMLTQGAFNCVGTFVGASPWRFVTSNFTLTASERVATNTSAAALTGTLPASPSAGTTVTVADGTYSWETYNLTISAAQPIEGVNENLICDASGKIIVLLYTGTTWRTLW